MVSEKLNACVFVHARDIAGTHLQRRQTSRQSSRRPWLYEVGILRIKSSLLLPVLNLEIETIPGYISMVNSRNDI